MDTSIYLRSSQVGIETNLVIKPKSLVTFVEPTSDGHNFCHICQEKCKKTQVQPEHQQWATSQRTSEASDGEVFCAWFKDV